MVDNLARFMVYGPPLKIYTDYHKRLRVVYLGFEEKKTKEFSFNLLAEPGWALTAWAIFWFMDIASPKL